MTRWHFSWYPPSLQHYKIPLKHCFVTYYLYIKIVVLVTWILHLVMLTF